MKRMNCYQMGGACQHVFMASSFDQIKALSQKHCREMMEQGDAEHLQAAQSKLDLMQDPAAMEAWFKETRIIFDGLPEVPA